MACVDAVAHARRQGASKAAEALESKIKYAVEHANEMFREEKGRMEAVVGEQREVIKKIKERNEEVREGVGEFWGWGRGQEGTSTPTLGKGTGKGTEGMEILARECSPLPPPLPHFAADGKGRPHGVRLEGAVEAEGPRRR
jgi:hypothetical protein